MAGAPMANATASGPSAKQRRMFAKMGIAMPDGSYYIRNAGDLSNAIMAVGRGEAAGDSGNAIRVHIMKRAAALKLTSKIPATWNSDGSLKQAAAHMLPLPSDDPVDIDDFLEHFGVKGMHWGVRHSPEKLEAQAADHENKAKAYGAAAKSLQADHDDLMKNGVNSRAMKRVYGDDVATQSDLRFQLKNGMSKAQALGETSSNLRVAHNSYARAANKHSAKAVKIRADLANTEHSDSNDEHFEHFGVKGMKWGVRRSRTASAPASEDASKAQALHAQVKSTGTHTLSNADLQHLVTRMNLEQQFTKLSGSDVSKGEKHLKTALKGAKLGLDAYNTGMQIKKAVDAAKKLGG